ncbi:MAG TPA: polysaccharide deacetylase family protein [Terriglobales bacterium]|nr:polysaccharide deacetylase family protein [Terriglobales bacterium]
MRAVPYAIVAFHRVPQASANSDELSFPAPAFADLCRYWHDHFEILNLDCLLARLAHRDPAAHACLTITFDDGYADNAEVAAPILDRLGLSATFFVATGAVGTQQCFPWDAALPAPPKLMAWNQVGELHRAGFGIGSHTVTHARVSAVRGSELERELQDSRRRLESELGEPVRDFAYPFGGPGDCDFVARQAVQQAGYRCCLSCHGGLIAPTDSPFRLHRISISPRYHATPRAWARQYLRARWHHRYGAAQAAASGW